MDNQLSCFKNERHAPAVADLMLGFVDELQRRGIRYCILRNYDDFPLPRSATSDIDMLVDYKHWDEANEILAERVLAGNMEFILSFIKPGGELLITFISDGSGPALHLDLYKHMTWKECEFASSDHIMREVWSSAKPQKPRLGHEAVISLLGYLLHRGMVKPEYRDKIHSLVSMDGAGFTTLLEHTWGKMSAEKLTDLIKSRDWGGVARWSVIAKRQFRIKNWTRTPMRAFARSLRMVWDGVGRLISPPGLMIALVGPDGCGKTTVGDGLVEALASVFPREKVMRLHWRPGLLPAPRSLMRADIRNPNGVTAAPDSTDPHGIPPYSRSISLARFSYFWIDFVLGALVKLRPKLARNALVLVDRYYYDFLVDQRRYRLNLPQRVIKCCSLAVPTPDLVFYLDAPESVLLARKQELPNMELRRQRKEFHRLKEELGETIRIVDVNRPILDVVEDMRRHVFAYLAERERRRGHMVGRE